MSENNNIKELCLIVYNFPNQVFLNKINFYFLLCKYKEYIKCQNKFYKILGHCAGAPGGLVDIYMGEVGEVVEMAQGREHEIGRGRGISPQCRYGAQRT